MGLDAWRARIDDLDRQILELLSQRAALSVEIGRAKRAAGLPVYAPEREQDLVEGLLQLNRGPLPTESVRAVWSEILSASRQLQQPFRVALLGPVATYTHLAARQRFGAGAEYVPVRGIADVFTEVERRRADVGVVPVENSTEGAVNVTLDELIESDLRISGEIQIEIHHQLLSRAGDLAEVKQVFAHPQALAQCSGWLDRHLPHVQAVDVASNAIGAERALEDPTTAAIASALASQVYGLAILRPDIEDHPHNVTRFWVIGHESPAPTGRDKTSILFSVRDEVGALFRVIEPFATGGCNLSKIESRPTRRRPWEYVFFVDFSGHQADPTTQAVLARVRDRCLFVKVLGSYPAAT
jgi:chorismate mutase/prephenate dehydratase